jgi:hypothetical protein
MKIFGNHRSLTNSRFMGWSIGTGNQEPFIIWGSGNQESILILSNTEIKLAVQSYRRDIQP